MRRRSWSDIDPTVFIDDDGTAWLAWGNPVLHLAKLKANMMPMTLDIPAGGQGVSGASGIVASDEFDRQPGDPALPLAWQWNHNPRPNDWSLTKRPGHLRLVTSRIASTLPEATNTLTQRTFGPNSSATTSIDVSGMKDGDWAGLSAFQKNYGSVGIKMTDGAKSLVMVSAASDKPEEIASIPLSGKTVHLKVESEFEPAPAVARFSCSLDGKSWTPIGRPSPDLFLPNALHGLSLRPLLLFDQDRRRPCGL